MLLALMAGLGAGALWGLTFLAPHFIGTASAGELVIVRFACYGAIAAVWLWRQGYNPFVRLGARDWLRLVVLGALGNSLYYLLTVLAVQAGSAGLTALIVGTLPVMFAVAGNLLHPTLPWGRLMLALAPILAGILLLGRQDGGGAALAFSWPGALLAAAAMASWLGFGLMNARYMASGPAPSPLMWAALLGVGTLATLPLAAVATLAQEGALFAGRLADYGPLLAAGIVLGLLSSWLATWLWNIASARIPPVALGYLIVSETLFALLYAFALEARWPSGAELASIALLVGGTLAGLRASRG